MDSPTLLSETSLSPPNLCWPSVSRVRLSLLSVGRARSPREICETEVSLTIGTSNHRVLSFVVFVKSEILAWSGSLMGVASSSAVIILSDSFGSCLVRWKDVARKPNSSSPMSECACPTILGWETSDKNPGTADQSRWPQGKSRDGADKDVVWPHLEACRRQCARNVCSATKGTVRATRSACTKPIQKTWKNRKPS